MTYVPAPAFRVLYGTGDATAAIDDFLVRFEFVDNISGKADEIQIQVEDRNGVFKGSFWPRKGDDLRASIGWTGGELDGLWPCGTFIIDEAQADGPPDTITIKALSSNIKKPMRQVNSRAFEGQTLRQIAEKIAADNAVTLAGEVPDITLARATQHRETDLGFLNRLAAEYGCIFKARGGEFVMHALDDVMSLDCQALITKDHLKRYTLRSKTADAPRAHVQRYFHPGHKAVIGQQVKDREPVILASVPVPGAKGVFSRSWIGADLAGRQDVGKYFEMVEDLSQADARIAARLLRAQMGQVEGSITIPGDPRIRASMSVWLDDLGLLTGAYLVVRARHVLTRDDYTTELDLSVNPKAPPKPTKKK